jgi:hypothetical protein
VNTERADLKASEEGFPNRAEGTPSQMEGNPNLAEGNPSPAEGFPNRFLSDRIYFSIGYPKTPVVGLKVARRAGPFCVDPSGAERTRALHQVPEFR